MPRFAVILPAAGSSSRFGGRQSKLIAELAGLPVITRALLPFIQHEETNQILIAVPNDPFAPTARPDNTLPSRSGRDEVPPATTRADEIWNALSRDPSVKNRLGGQIAMVPGGANRAESVRAALKRVPDDVEWVAIHDAARPLVSHDLINRTLAAAVEYGAAGPAMPVNLTIKQAAGPLPATIQKTIPRNDLFAMQTPQIMRRETLLRAFELCSYPLEHVTDDLQLLELVGEQAWLVPGEEQNLKITTPQDLLLAELLLRRR